MDFVHVNADRFKIVWNFCARMQKFLNRIFLPSDINTFSYDMDQFNDCFVLSNEKSKKQKKTKKKHTHTHKRKKQRSFSSSETFVLSKLMVKHMDMVVGTVEKTFVSVSYSNVVWNLALINLVKQKLQIKYGINKITW